MPVSIGEYSFEGPFTHMQDLEKQPGVFAVFCIRANGALFVLDVDEGQEIRSAVETHPRKECWVNECTGIIAIGTLYTREMDRNGRKDIERKIRLTDFVPCGGECS